MELRHVLDIITWKAVNAEQITARIILFVLGRCKTFLMFPVARWKQPVPCCELFHTKDRLCDKCLHTRWFKAAPHIGHTCVNQPKFLWLIIPITVFLTELIYGCQEVQGQQPLLMWSFCGNVYLVYNSDIKKAATKNALKISYSFGDSGCSLISTYFEISTVKLSVTYFWVNVLRHFLHTF